MLGDYVFSSKYAKYIPGSSRRESYAEAMDRYIAMMLERFPALSTELEECREALHRKQIVGSQRGLQFGGVGVTQNNLRLYNCSTLYIDRVRAFSETLYLLLCGCGVGFSVQKHHIAKLPQVNLTGRVYYHAVGDSIEGWAEACQALFAAYLSGGDYPNFDFSGVRKKGASISHGGKAPGPKPLQLALQNCDTILSAAVGRKLSPIEAFDCCMHLSDAVVSGGIRRSAALTLFSIDDQEMLTAKTGDWFIKNGQRGRANISALISPDTPEKQFKEIFSSTKQFGEPGFLFLNSSEHLLNPCAEVSMCPTLIKDPHGNVVEQYTLELVNPENRAHWEAQGYTFESGVSLCNLTEINMSKVQTEEEFYRLCRLATILGTLQASFTDLKYLTPCSRQIVEREALLGVSITGVFSNELFRDQNILNKGAYICNATNIKYANLIGIKEASRITLIKPSGTASIVLESAAGAHPWHAAKYIRRVQADAFEPLYQFVEAQQPERCFKSVWGGEHARVIAFACEAPSGAVLRDSIGAITHLELVKHLNENWVRQGTLHEERLEAAYHNVSCTVTVNSEEEWESVAAYLFKNKSYFTGVSLLGGSGDYQYQQAPLQEVREDYSTLDNPDQRAEMLALWNSIRGLPDLDFSLCLEDSDNTKLLEAVACAGGQCDITFDKPAP